MRALSKLRKVPLTKTGLLRVLVFSPPLDKSGGIGALFTYARPHFPQDVEVTFVDTRGYWKNPTWSTFSLVAGIWTLLIARFRNRVDVIHLNLGARGSAFRKVTLGTLSIFILRVPTVFQLHASTFEEFFRELPVVIQKWMILVFNGASKLLVLGTSSKAMMEKIGCHTNLVETFQMGVPDLRELNQSTQNKEFSEKKAKICPVVLFAGELGARKGLPQILESLSSMPDIPMQLIVAGSGHLEKWQEFSNSLGLRNRVSFIGLVPYSAIHRYLNLVDALILPSRAEGLPVSVLECMSAGKTPIVTLSGNLSDFLNDTNSIIISNPTVDDIARALRNFSCYFRLGQTENLNRVARSLWREDYDVHTTTNILVDIWKTTLKK